MDREKCTFSFYFGVRVFIIGFSWCYIACFCPYSARIVQSAQMRLRRCAKMCVGAFVVVFVCVCVCLWVWRGCERYLFKCVRHGLSGLYKTVFLVYVYVCIYVCVGSFRLLLILTENRWKFDATASSEWFFTRFFLPYSKTRPQRFAVWIQFSFETTNTQRSTITK